MNVQDSENNLRDEASYELSAYGRILLSGLIDGIFLVLWAFFQWGLSKAIVIFPLESTDATMLGIFQGLFAITTLVPILAHLTRNIVIITLRAWYSTKREINKIRETYHTVQN